jgi:hypothetical protein
VKENIMPVLLLAQGDPEAKNKLRKAIDTRYGPRPVMVDSLAMAFKGRVKTRVGPVSAWSPFEAQTFHRFPQSLRLDWTTRAMGVKSSNTVETFDGEQYRQSRGGALELVDSPERLRLLRMRMWAMANAMLTPLSDSHITLENAGELGFAARHSNVSERCTIVLRPNATVESVEMVTVSVRTAARQALRIDFSPELTQFDDCLYPAKFRAFWNDDLLYEAVMTCLRINNEIPTETFRSGQGVSA